MKGYIFCIMSGVKRSICLIGALIMGLMLMACKDEEPESINAALKKPCDVRVSSPYMTLMVEPYAYNFSYAVNEKEWCSEIADSDHPINLSYDSFVEVFFTNKTRLTFDFAVKPDKLIYVRRYDASLIDSECDEDEMRLGERFERAEEYEMFEELEIPDEMIFPYTLVVDNDKAYLYEIAAIWDREDCRGTGYYSFVVRKRNRNVGK